MSFLPFKCVNWDIVFGLCDNFISIYILVKPPKSDHIRRNTSILLLFVAPQGGKPRRRRRVQDQ